MKSSKLQRNGFTLIELLVVISIIGVLIAISIFGLQGARAASRDAKRKADLELIRSGLELYKSDCGVYPAAVGGRVPSPLVGSGPPPANCLVSNSYISSVPADPQVGTRSYGYSSDGTTYQLCAALEQGGADSCSVGCTVACNYRVINP